MDKPLKGSEKTQRLAAGAVRSTGPLLRVVADLGNEPELRRQTARQILAHLDCATASITMLRDMVERTAGALLTIDLDETQLKLIEETAHGTQSV